MDAASPLAEPEHLAMLRVQARRLLRTEWSSRGAVERARDPDALRQVWLLAASAGWTALAVDDLGAALVLMQELGRASCPLPIMDAVLANAALGDSGSVAGALLEQLHAGEAVVTWIFAEDVDGPVAGELRLSGSSLSGTAAFVESTAIATHFVVVTGTPGQMAIVERASSGVHVTPTPGLADPPLAEVTFDGTQAAVVQSAFLPVLLAPTARVLLAARATGSAEYGLELLTDYVKVRTQFGKLIGEYQAVQHKLANCLISVEVCRLALRRAGSASPSERAYATAVAATHAGTLLRDVVLELHHGFGGVSFWHDHELPRHFHRIHADLTRLGGVHQARRDVALEVLATGALPAMSYGPAADEFRAEVREWLGEHWDGTYPPETLGLPVNERKARPEFSRMLGAKGWLSVTWPREHGGQERSALEHLALEEEMAYSEAPVTWHNTSANMIGPALLRHGSEEHQATLVPGIATGRLSFALGYSEPEHGSDLAGLRTTARRSADGGWTVRGQKTFTSAAAWATHIWLAVRTDPERPRQSGISVLVLPMDTPGIIGQPMTGLSGHSASIIFFDDVEVPASALVGAENGGWQVITDALTFERISMGALGARARGYFDKLIANIRTPADALALDRIGKLAAELDAARLFAVEVARIAQEGGVPRVEAAMLKVYSSELMEQLCEGAFDLLGTGAALQAGVESAVGEGVFEYGVRDALQYTIGGGTNEIQRSLIARHGLHLPG